MTYTDWLGQPIEVGSPVLYAVSNSHYAVVVWAEVLEIIPVEPQMRDVWSPEDMKLIRHKRGAPIGKEEYWPYGRTFKLKVQPYYQNSDFRELRGASWSSRGIDSDWRAEKGSRYKRALPKPVTIQNVEKVTVFPLPDGARERLERLLDEAVERANNR